MNKFMRSLWVIIIVCIISLEAFCVKANCAINNLTVTGENNEIKVIIGILILSLITALVTLKRVISAKKNN